MAKKSVLFVCKNNAFRSVVAELFFKKYLKDNKIKGWNVSSAGLLAKRSVMDPLIYSAIKSYSIKSFSHKQKKLTKNMLNKFDAIIVMDEYILKSIKEKFGVSHVFLFDYLAINKISSINDVECNAKIYDNKKRLKNDINNVVSHIVKNIPRLVNNVNERYYFFSGVAVSNKHLNGYPLIKLYESRNVFAIMSLDIPQKEDGHILVLPKKRYASLSQVPSKLVLELMSAIKKIGIVLSRDHDGYNVLLNDGAAAKQYFFHTHFHLIPRRFGDKIKIEVWSRRSIPTKKFIKLSNDLKAKLNND